MATPPDPWQNQLLAALPEQRTRECCAVVKKEYDRLLPPDRAI